MENEFSALAIQKLLQLFPELSSLIVSFKDITDEVPSLEETDVSVGIFILQTGDKSFYLPIISKGEAIQPLDSIFDNNEQCFIPLTKGFVTRMVNSSINTLGKPTKIPDTVSQNPSIYSLVTPPRTGKFVYASSSKLEEFLTTLPNLVKEAVLDKFSSDKDVYSALHKLFGLENLFASLKPTVVGPVATPKASVELITEGSGLDDASIQDILTKGYALKGGTTSTRIAVQANDYNAMGKLRQLSAADAGQDFDICTKSGETLQVSLLKNSKYVPQKPALFRHDKVDNVIALFQDGSWAKSPSMVAVGEGRDGKATIHDVISSRAKTSPEGLTGASIYFAILSPELELIDLCAYPRVSRNKYGVTIVADSKLTDSTVTINAYKNCTTINCQDRSNIFIPINTLILNLTKAYNSDTLETNINSAASRLELATMTALGSALNIGFDGVEFHINKKVVGQEPDLMKVLVVEEGIAPEKAESFMKQAKEVKHVRVYLSKKADAESDVIPSYGTAAAPQQGGFGINGDFTNNVNQAIQTNDAEVVEATIISELLQVADMKSYIREYLPEIKASIDKLGRSLFLCRLKMDQLASDHTASEVFSFVAGIRNTYRMLGETYLKLEGMTSNSEDTKQ